MKALVFDRFGGPDVLGVREIPTPALEPGTALVRMHAIGLNFADVYRRKGNYHLEGAPPYVLGYEGAGVVDSVDSSLPDDGETPAFRVGDRVAFADVPHANAEVVRAPLSRLVPLPESTSFETAAAILLQGLTADYLVRDSYVLRPGELAVVHAAAGGVGLLLVQHAKLAGASVVGLTSSRAKAEAAAAAGADWTASYDDDWPEVARARSRDGRGADVVYDSVGVTVPRSLDAARVGGHVVFYGMAGGDPPLVDPRRLMDTSKSLTGGDLWNVLTSSAERTRRSKELFDRVARGGIRPTIAQVFPLAHGADAHALLESRGVIGKILLLP